jgi:hypothetical protein
MSPQPFRTLKLKAGAISMETEQQKLGISDEATNYVIKKGGEVVVDYISGDN